MSGTTDKPAETPAQPEVALVSDKPADRTPSRLFWPSPKTVRHVVIEVLIVAVGVLLALGIDQLRQHLGRLAQAEETRQLLRDEISLNLDQTEQGMRNLQRVYARIEEQPETAPSLKTLSGMGGSFPYDAAYTVTLQTGAFAYLNPEERILFSNAYLFQKYMGGFSTSYSEAFREMLSFPSGKLDNADRNEARLQQVKRVQNWAQALFAAECRTMVRYRMALGEWKAEVAAFPYCRNVDPLTEDVEALIAGRRAPQDVVIPEPEPAEPATPN